MKRQPTWGGGRPPSGTPSPTAYLHTFEEAGRLLGGISRREVARLVDRDLLTRVEIGPRNHRVTDESIRAFIARSSRHDGTGGDAGKGGPNDRAR